MAGQQVWDWRKFEPSDFAPSAGTPVLVAALPDGAGWYLVTKVFVRDITAVPTAVSYRPQFFESAALDPTEVLLPQPTVIPVATMYAVIQQFRPVAFFSSDGNMYCQYTPTVFGDTFRCRMWVAYVSSGEK